MPDREKVIKEFALFIKGFHPACTSEGDELDLFREVIAILNEQKELLKEQEAVVKCKDCKHATMTSDGKMCKYCAMDTDDFGDQRDVYHDADFFCAYGEREGSK